MAEHERTFGEHVQQKTTKRQEQMTRQVIRTATEHGNRATVLRDIDQLAEVVEKHLVPNLLEERSGRELRKWADRLDDHPFDTAALWAFIDNGQRDEATVSRAFKSLQSIAMHEGYVEDEMRNYVAARGLDIQLGVMHKKFEYNSNDGVDLVSYHSGETKTIFNGKTGSGKSTGLSADVEDRYNAGLKIIDIIDKDEFESAVYDIPQNQSSLRAARRRMGLPEDFTESDEHEQPELEILVPLTKGFEDEEIPFDTRGDGKTPTVRPYTIPASELSKRVITNFLAGAATPEQQSIITDCLEQLRDDISDYTLKDIAERIANLEGLGDNFKRRIVRQLRTLQDKGFIRDKTCEHQIDWEELFRDTQTITAFSQAFMRDVDNQLMVISHLTNSVYYKRRELATNSSGEKLPRVYVVGRELHEIAPHSQESLGSKREQELHKAISGELGYVMKKNRHQDIEIGFDTQDFTDIRKGVRKRFNRAVSFKTTDETLEELFAQIAGNTGVYYDYRRTITTSDAGRGTVIGNTGPNAQNSTPFLSPIQFAPPSWHVYDTDEHETGLHARVAYLEHEDWANHDWDASIPEDLEVPELEELENPDEDEEEQIDRKEFHKQEARNRARQGETVRQIQELIPNNPRTENPYSISTIHGWISDVERDPTTQAQV